MKCIKSNQRLGRKKLRVQTHPNWTKGKKKEVEISDQNC